MGLGKKAGSKYFHTSGKTGTAQIWTKNGFCSEYLISFAGYFPSENPLYSCIVCIRKGAPASGGGMCAPVFRRVAETVMAQRRSNDYSTARDTLNCMMPVVCAGNLQAAETVLDELRIARSGDLPEQEGALPWGVCQTRQDGLTLETVTGEESHTVPDVRGYGLRDALFRLEKMGLKVKVKGVGRVSAQSLKPGTTAEAGHEIELVLGNPDDIPKAARTDTLKRDTVQAVREDTVVDHELNPHAPAAGNQETPPPAKTRQKEAVQPAAKPQNEAARKAKADTGKRKDMLR